MQITNKLLLKLAKGNCSKQQLNLVMKECRLIAEKIVATPQDIGTFYITKGKHKQRYFQLVDIPEGSEYRTIRYEKDKGKRKLMAQTSFRDGGKQTCAHKVS